MFQIVRAAEQTNQKNYDTIQGREFKNTMTL